MKLKAYAKINLTLDIKGKRPDGYHLLSMIMQSVGLSDMVTLRESDKIIIRSSHRSLPDGKNNTAYAAAKLFFEKTGMDKGADILIEKNIPLAAGLGGGSADAAAVLVGLNQLYQEPLDRSDLCKLGLQVGADVPFCITGGTALAEGIGEKIRPLPQMPSCGIVLIKPCGKPSTGEMYRRADSSEPLLHPDNDAAEEALGRGDLYALCSAFGNSFDSVWTIPEISEVKVDLQEAGAAGVSLSGSGPTVFGVFESYERAKNAVESLRGKYGQIYVTVPKTIGCEII